MSRLYFLVLQEQISWVCWHMTETNPKHLIPPSTMRSGLFPRNHPMPSLLWGCLVNCHSGVVWIMRYVCVCVGLCVCGTVCGVNMQLTHRLFSLRSGWRQVKPECLFTLQMTSNHRREMECWHRAAEYKLVHRERFCAGAEFAYHQPLMVYSAEQKRHTKCINVLCFLLFDSPNVFRWGMCTKCCWWLRTMVKWWVCRVPQQPWSTSRTVIITFQSSPERQ